MCEKILTLHPQGKQGVNISKDKYDAIRTAIVNALATHGELSYSELTKHVSERLAGQFDGSISWYVTTVKLDLEARGIVKRVPGGSPQLLRLETK